MTESLPTVLVWVTHLLGTGHLFRTAAIVRSLRRRGARVVVATGGMAVDGIDFADAELTGLAAVRSPDATFRALVDADGGVVDDRFLDRRAAVLVDLLVQTKPDAVVTELYPFGRRKFWREVDQLLEQAATMSPRPLLAASIRDIVEPPANERQVDFAVGRLERLYDLVLVHGDPAFVALDRAFPLPTALAGLLRYTGYIGGSDGCQVATGSTDGAGEIVVSAGGGVVGVSLYQAALDASLLPGARGWQWRVLVGSNVCRADFERLAGAASGNVTVERARPDFPALLHRAAVSVSQAGYNTAADILDARIPAVVVPFCDGGAQEQTVRAGLMAEAGRAVVLPARDLSASTLVAAVAAARALSPDAMRPVAMAGGNGSADIIMDAVAQKGRANGDR